VIATLAELLRARAAEMPDALALRFLHGGEPDGAEPWSYAELDRRARAVAARLLEAGAAGEPVLLVFAQGLDFAAAFFGCQYAGAIAVPTTSPDPSRMARTLARLGHVARDCGARLVLSTSLIAGLAPPLEGLTWVPVEGLAGDAAPRDLDPAAPAFLQYTSGSTGDPRGVTVSHRAILENERLIAEALDTSPMHVVSWLPLFHDMGLIGALLHPLYTGGWCTFFSPADFLQRPLRWLRAMARFGGDTAAAPNFAYDLCARKARPDDLAGLDLSRWRAALVGSEPVRPATLERFAATFAPAGFRREALYPCYGLAEATLFVTGGVAGEGPRVARVDATALAHGRVEPGEREVVSSGVVRDGAIVAIVDETGARCPAGRVGEIWVRGPSVAAGYWRRPEETRATFAARLDDGAYLRTGDLGFLDGGHLHVAGRLKDLIIVRGANHHPNDLERTVEECHAAVRPGGAAAFGVEVEGEERAVVAVEVTGEPAAVAAAARAAVLAEHGLLLHDVVPLAPRALPKTSSGKIMRRACRAAYLSGELS
jgi:acyl-CoA synthetase (AMP-forming)/AMP-acid ligase II